MAANLKYTLHQYGTDHKLQRLGVWEINSEPTRRSRHWIVYIHGGAWRDPRITHEAFEPSINHICSSQFDRWDDIAGFASIDYRLSAHPQFPQDPKTTPPYEYRGARHPDHLDDVRSALVLLQQKYNFTSNYVLVGHSAGGSLAFQLAATSPMSSESVQPDPVLPAAIVSLEGLYDFPGINERFKGAYAPFFEAAFGGAAEWYAASPIKYHESYARKWPEGNLIILAYSRSDTLLDGDEVDNMAERLVEVDRFAEIRVGSDEGPSDKRLNRLVVHRDLRGDHDEIWQDGEEVARMVSVALHGVGNGVTQGKMP
ncbi:alpha/beta-hydrolase [Poronia punctata]|nr:alpha/beta-hydrolase [Poronia punctata]